MLLVVSHSAAPQPPGDPAAAAAVSVKCGPTNQGMGKQVHVCTGVSQHLKTCKVIEIPVKEKLEFDFELNFKIIGLV